MKRVIFVEPNIKNGDEIIKFFNKYNPDSNFINPHICLVFPFESNKSKEELKTILSESLFDIYKFEVELSGFSISYEPKNNFLFLNVSDEKEILAKITSRLYKKLDGEALLKSEYTPHITIGKASSIDEINKIHEIVSDLKVIKFNAAIDKVCCKIFKKIDDKKIILKDEVEIILK